MFIAGFLGWWYGAGFSSRMSAFGLRLLKGFDTFSIDLLAKTWFSPFRQISAGQVRGPLVVQMRAFFDRLFSRVIGAIFRTLMMIVGVIWLVFLLLFSILELGVWLLLPVVPVLGAILFAIGWTPL